MLLCSNNYDTKIKANMDRIEIKTDSKLRMRVVEKHSASAAKEYAMLANLDSDRIIKPIELRGDCIVFPEYPERAANGIAGYCTEKEVWHFIRDVAEGLEYIHNKGIIHGDIKPSNVLIADEGYIINDFDMEGDLTSFAFTPPEWSRNGENINAKSDIWSLGASVFNLINGTYIFNGRGAMLQKENTKIPSLRNDKYSEILSETISKCMSFNSQDRPSPKELIELSERMMKADDVKKPKINISKTNISTYIHDEIWPEKMI